MRIVQKKLQEVYCRNEENADHAVENAVILLRKWRICESYRRNRRKSTAETERIQIVPKKSPEPYCRIEEFADSTAEAIGTLL